MWTLGHCWPTARIWPKARITFGASRSSWNRLVLWLASWRRWQSELSISYSGTNNLPHPPIHPLYLHSPQSATRIPGYKERLAVLQQQTGYTNTATVNGSGATSDVALQEMRQLQNTARHNELRKDLLQGRRDSPSSPSLCLLTLFPPPFYRCRHTAPATWRGWWWRLRRCWGRARRQHEWGGQVSYHSAGEDHRAHALPDAQSQGANGDCQ